ncbi:NAD(P)-dependent oxidoreductase [Botrimarina sp.]|uniref:NAD(P)-dependent oxidoreductase n=1 Tax=Botrimarina sp. TaxID=2795802 RepID=UPI0032EEAB51
MPAPETSAESQPPIGVIGLGLLGSALADRLLDSGFAVRCWNRTREKAAPLLERGAQWSDNPFSDCETVVVCVYTADVVRETLERMAPAFRGGRLVIDATTAGPDDAPQIGAWLARSGVGYLECPIAASSEQTRRGEAVAFVGGSAEDLRRARPVVDALAASAHHVGPWGAAAKFKLVNNLILGLNRAALAEGLALAGRLGLELTQTLDVLRQCNAYSGVMDTKGAKMVAGDWSTQARLAQHGKDVRIILQQARSHGLELPLTSTHLGLLERGEQLGYGDLDNSAILRVIAESNKDN